MLALNDLHRFQRSRQVFFTIGDVAIKYCSGGHVLARAQVKMQHAMHDISHGSVNMQQGLLENTTYHEKIRAASWRVVEFCEFSDYVDMTVVVEGRNLQRQILAFIRFSLIGIVGNVKEVSALGSGN